MDNEKILTARQAEALLLISPGVGGSGLSHKHAAAQMGISQQALNRLIRSAEKMRPDLFPMLTAQEYEVWTLIQCGVHIEEITERLMNSMTGDYGVSRSRVEKIITALRKKGRDVLIKHPTEVSYQSWMDAEIKEKF
jgi:predicted DNA-binding protein (UPF0251 family)